MRRYGRRSSRKRIVAVGGGTGVPNWLRYASAYDVETDVLVTMADAGDNARVAKDQWGMLPPSDFWKCLVALAPRQQTEREALLRRMFAHRLPKEFPNMGGMTGGNLQMMLLHEMNNGNMELAVRDAHVLILGDQPENGFKDRVIPVTYDQADLRAVYGEGLTATGENVIDEPQEEWQLTNPINGLSLIPGASLSEDAAEAIADADAIIVGPGSLYTSINACMVVEGMRQAIQRSRAKYFVWIGNVATQPGQVPADPTAIGHMHAVEEYMGREFTMAFMDTAVTDPDNDAIFGPIVNSYRTKGAYLIYNNMQELTRTRRGFRVIERPFIDTKITVLNPNELVNRDLSVLRHHGPTLTAALLAELGVL